MGLPGRESSKTIRGARHRKRKGGGPMRQAFVPAAALLGAALMLGAGAQAQTTERVSVASDRTEANEYSFDPNITPDGRFVAFFSYATNLVPGDTNGQHDVFVHDRDLGTTDRVSVASDGTEGNDWSSGPAISTDGRFVAFESDASNLVRDDANDIRDVFVHDRDTGVTELASVASGGSGAGGGHAVLSSDGQFVAFISGASNLVPDDTNLKSDVFVRDMDTGMVVRVSVASDGTQANNSSSFPAISADGRFVAFDSFATNLVEGDTNNAHEIFVHDRDTGTTERVAVASDGTQGNGQTWSASISADGRFVAFRSNATNLVPGDTNHVWDIFVRDREAGSTERVSIASDGAEGNSDSRSPSISADGRFVAFSSTANDLVADDTNSNPDIFVHDRVTGTTERVSVASDGTQGDLDSYQTSISADGRFVAFLSYSTNLVPDDTNGFRDIFVHDRGAPPQLVVAGACPGGVSVSLTGATPEGQVAFGWGTGEGRFTLPAGLCFGAEIGLADPHRLIVLTADPSGAISRNETLGAGACGRLLQALDVATCTPSNVAGLP